MTGGGSRVGTIFGPYELQSLLGVGGMGEAYRAYDTAKDRTVALKLLRAELSADAGFQERFRRESRIAARLQEPHVIGPRLRRDQRCALHRHADVKPENVLLTPNDFAYLVDFGIAHLGGDTGLTSAGAAIGSCAYTAPERFTGGSVSPAADVYSLGCLLHECLTAAPPFPTGELSQLMGAHIMSPPPRPSVTRPGITAAFDAVVAHGMAKQPEERFSSAGELARATSAAAAVAQMATAINPVPQRTVITRQFVATPPAQSPPARRGFGRTQWVLAVAAVGVFAAVVGLVLWLVLGQNRTGQVAAPPSTTATEAPTTQATSTSQAPVALPGTDAQGFIDYPGARCDAGSSPAALARTTQSVFMVCRAGPGEFYYRGIRLSDGAGIELANVVRSSGGFDVTNPTDGTRYQIRPDGLTIVPPDGQAITEPMVQYATS